MLLDVVVVKPQPDFKLDLEFANGELRRFDMRPLLAVRGLNRGQDIKLRAARILPLLALTAPLRRIGTGDLGIGDRGINMPEWTAGLWC